VSTAPATGPAHAAPPRLTRSRDDRVLAGVAGGLGRYLGVDPLVVRLGFIVLALAWGGGVLAYLVAWLLVPEDTADEVAGAGGSGEADLAARRVDAAPLLGLFLVAVGGLLLLDRLLPAFSWRYVAPVILVALGVLLIARQGASR
jgi:phage shock protein C